MPRRTLSTCLLWNFTGTFEITIAATSYHYTQQVQYQEVEDSMAPHDSGKYHIMSEKVRLYGISKLTLYSKIS